MKIKRDGFVDQLRQWATNLRHMDIGIKTDMEPGVRKVMEGNHIASVGKLVEEVGFDDQYLVRDLVAGMKVVGPLGTCGEYPSVLAMPLAPLDDLVTAARWYQHAARGPHSQHVRGSQEQRP